MILTIRIITMRIRLIHVSEPQSLPYSSFPFFPVSLFASAICFRIPWLNIRQSSLLIWKYLLYCWPVVINILHISRVRIVSSGWVSFQMAVDLKNEISFFVLLEIDVLFRIFSFVVRVLFSISFYLSDLMFILIALVLSLSVSICKSCYLCLILYLLLYLSITLSLPVCLAISNSLPSPSPFFTSHSLSHSLLPTPTLPFPLPSSASFHIPFPPLSFSPPPLLQDTRRKAGLCDEGTHPNRVADRRP